jgi:hypothetical protein
MVNSLNVAPNGRDRSTADRSRDLRATDVIRWVLHWLGYLLIYTWYILIFALIGANFGGFLGETGQHWGWIIGAALGLVGIPLGKVQMDVMGKILAYPPWRPKRHRSLSRPPNLPDQDPSIALAPAPRRRLQWDTRFAVFSSIVGVVVGGLLGGILLTSWFSIAMSPFAPALWSESVTYSDPADPTNALNSGDRYSAGVVTENRLALFLFLGPLIGVPLLGFVLGGLNLIVDFEDPETQAVKRKERT